MPVRSAPRTKFLAAMTLATALAAFPLGALASHQFADVPDSNPFHADISALANSGVTSGCGGGNYCPSANVTREQMAAFLNRLGALAPGKTPVVNATKLDGLDSSQFERSDTVTTGHFNCSGNTMQPIGNSGSLSWSGPSFTRTSATAAAYGCNVVLPNGATAVSVDFYVSDLSTTEQVVGCSMGRLELATGAVDNMATGASTGVESDPGPWVLQANVFSGALIDNATHAYHAQCTLSGPGTEIWGISVEYTVAGVAMP